MSHIRVVMPVFDDWEAATCVVTAVTAAAAGRGIEFLLVDDGSRSLAPPALAAASDGAAIEVLTLRRNLGHQRAIAIGLAYAEAKHDGAWTVVMDGDGEDRPEDVMRLIAAAEQAQGASIVFAERTRRSEGLIFSVFYHAYRAVHWLLTGERVRVGNFSVIPAALLPRLVAVSDLWNHYAAAVFKSRMRYSTIPTTRGARYAGSSTMNYVALVTHGLSAMAAFGDRVGVRLLTATLGLSAAGIVAFAFALRQWAVSTGGAAGAWMPLAAVFVLVMLFQAVSIALTFVFVILGGRDSSTFLPLRDYHYYVLEATCLGRIR